MWGADLGCSVSAQGEETARGQDQAQWGTQRRHEGCQIQSEEAQELTRFLKVRAPELGWAGSPTECRHGFEGSLGTGL